MQEDLDSLLGEVEAEVRGTRPIATTESVEGDVPVEGGQGGKGEGVSPTAKEGLSETLLRLLLMFQKVSPSLPLKTRRTRKTPPVGRKMMCLLLFVDFASYFFPHRGWG
ncbi:UNVERIFIED_CONTAM: hypothetical protein Slati_0822200 [Sesamum latifolium]|uniref:Uncharacterized protein n=1 Tax=Sesamum latifolium TaxID=2727402 RepID=A0AAW2XSQ0_9LAMI